MKRVVLLLFAAVLFATVGWSQTVTLKFKNGTTQQYNMSELESVDFTDENTHQGSTLSLVGTWDAVSSRFYDNKGWEETEDETGYWVFTDTKVTAYDEEDLLNGKSYPYTFDGKKLVINVQGYYATWEMVKFSGNTMVLKTEIIGAYQETTFKKR